MNKLNYDTELLKNILVQICDYAVKNNLQPDETIEIMAESMLALLKISTFNSWNVEKIDRIFEFEEQ